MKAFIVLYFASIIGVTYQAGVWSYDYETQWPGKCQTGQQQSPINIITRDALVDRHEAHIRGPLAFRGYNQVKMSAINNGHTLQWNVEWDHAPVLSGGPLRGNYSLLQFHLHWLSEHALDGMKYPLEIHMVHIKTGLTVDEALKRPDGLAVMGVLCQVLGGANNEYALAEIMPVVPDLVIRTEDENAEANIIDVTRLFSPDPQSFYTYHGSLTTPTCDESVTWIVMDKPLSISDTQYKIFSKVDVGGMDNYRSLQPANRVVYRSVRSCSTMLSPSFLALLATVFSCFTSRMGAAVSKALCIVSNVKRRVFFGDNLSECAKFLTD